MVTSSRFGHALVKKLFFSLSFKLFHDNFVPCPPSSHAVINSEWPFLSHISVHIMTWLISSVAPPQLSLFQGEELGYCPFIRESFHTCCLNVCPSWPTALQNFTLWLLPALSLPLTPSQSPLSPCRTPASTATLFLILLHPLWGTSCWQHSRHIGTMDLYSSIMMFSVLLPVPFPTVPSPHLQFDWCCTVFLPRMAPDLPSGW